MLGALLVTFPAPEKSPQRSVAPFAAAGRRQRPADTSANDRDKNPLDRGQKAREMAVARRREKVYTHGKSSGGAAAGKTQRKRGYRLGYKEDRIGYADDAGSLSPALEGASLANSDDGVKIVNVQQGSMAQRLGLKNGDVITGLNRSDVGNIAELKSLLNKTKGRISALRVVRGNSEIFITLR